MSSKNINTITRALMCLGVFLLANGVSFAQDIIINDTNEALHVKIRKIKKDFIYYDSTGTDKPFRDSIARTHVLSYVEDLFPVEKEPKEPNYNYEVFRFSFGLGWSKILFKPENYDDFTFGQKVIDELYSGTDINLLSSVFLSENFGFGIKYSRYASSSTDTDFYMNSVGPLLSLRAYDKKNNNTFLISAGGLKVYTKESAGNLESKNETWVASFDFSGDIKLDNHVYLQIFSSLVLGFLDAENTELYNNGQLINSISFESTSDPITRFTIGLGLVIAL